MNKNITLVAVLLIAALFTQSIHAFTIDKIIRDRVLIKDPDGVMGMNDEAYVFNNNGDIKGIIKIIKVKKGKAFGRVIKKHERVKKGDIVELVNHFSTLICEKNNFPKVVFEKDTLKLLHTSPEMHVNSTFVKAI